MRKLRVKFWKSLYRCVAWATDSLLVRPTPRAYRLAKFTSRVELRLLDRYNRAFNLAFA